MKTAPARWLPGTGTQPEALIKEARRRQRRRYLVAGVAVIVAAAGTAAVSAGSGAGSRPRLPGARSGLTASVLAQNARAADLLRQIPGEFSLTRHGTTVSVRVRLAHVGPVPVAPDGSGN